jgi:hypothetical protein
MEDEALKGHATLSWQRASGRGLRLSAYRSYRDASDEPEVSLVRNSFASQEFGSDYTEPFDARGAVLAAQLGAGYGMRWRAEAAYERHAALDVNATPASGRFERTIPAARASATRVLVGAERATAAAPFGATLGARAEARATRFDPRGSGADALAERTTVGRLSGVVDAARPFGATLGARAEARATRFDPRGSGADALAERTTVGRLSGVVDATRPFGARQLALRLTAAYADGSAGVPAQELVYLGGPTSGPGYRFHEFVGELGATARVEWRAPVPFPSLPLGRFGRTAGTATLAPFAHAVYVTRPAALGRGRGGWYPAVGVGAFTLFDVLRFDVARGLRDGRWTFSVDAARPFWGVL